VEADLCTVASRRSSAEVALLEATRSNANRVGRGGRSGWDISTSNVEHLKVLRLRRNEGGGNREWFADRRPSARGKTKDKTQAAWLVDAGLFASLSGALAGRANGRLGARSGGGNAAGIPSSEL
jgi:hypothetical protein